MRFVASLPPPMVYDRLNRISWISVLRRKKYVAPRSSRPTLSIIYRVKKGGKVINAPKRQSKRASWKLINYLRPNNADKQFVKQSIVENTRRRPKRDIDYPIKSARTVKPVEVPKHQKRSKTTNIQETPSRLLSILQNLKYAPNLAMFYRHPELSVEEQHQQLNKNLKEPSKSRTAREENRDTGLKVSRTRYSPVFKECNDATAASEVEDLNIPPPRPKYLKPRQPYVPDTDLPAKNHFDLSSRKPIAPQMCDEKLGTAKIDEEPKQIKRPKASEIQSASSKNATSTNGTYVNLRDHQEEAKKMGALGGNSRNKVSHTSSPSGVSKYPKDMQPYNPDNIPYVEVPDYTDQREESLDEDDRRVAKERYRNGKDEGEDEDKLGTTLILGSDDVVDPDTPDASDALPDPGKNTPRKSLTVPRNKATGKSRSVQEHRKDGDREKGPESVDTPLHSDVSFGAEEDASETSKDRSDEKATDGITDNPDVRGLPLGVGQDGKKIDDDNDGSIEDKSKNEKDDDSPPTVDFQPVHFDINEYIKPFDYSKLFGGEGEKSKEESSDYSTDDSREEAGSERSNSDAATFPDRFSARYRKPSENETFFKFDVEKDDSDEYVKEFAIIKPDEFSFGNKDFFKPISDEEREKSDRFASESDFLSSFFSEDVIRKLGSDESDTSDVSDTSDRRDTSARSDTSDHSDKTEGEKLHNTSSEVKEEAYRTLSTSLEQKDHFPKFEDDQIKEAKEDRVVRPREYNNFWTLEYTFPPEKINHELRKESAEEKI